MSIPAGRRGWLLALVVLFGETSAGPAAPAVGAGAGRKVVLVTDETVGAPVRHGLGRLKRALESKGIAVDERSALPGAGAVAGRGGSAESLPMVIAGRSVGLGAAAARLASLRIPPPTDPESLLVRHIGPVLLVTGADDRGLMYALLDVAARVGWAADPRRPFREVRDVAESPAVRERALSIYTMHRAWFESRFFDEAHWSRYFDMLAEDRFNTFALLFGYENAGYFAPAYPYFFDIEAFPDVRVVGFTPEDQRRHFQALQRLIRMAHDRGLRVTIGLWDHVYRGGVQAGGMDVAPGAPVPGIVTGLTEANLTAYHVAALTRFVQLFPEVDTLQFRMHGESGLKQEEMHGFWTSLYRVMKTHAPRMRFDARAKDLPDSIIQAAVDMGLDFRVTTKYWAEQMGLPFHPTHINRQNQLDRRHGYADLLRYPKTYPMNWQLWSGGTTRVLLWGDPEWVRRFAQSTHLYDGDGYEVNEMLATKMASQPHDMKRFDLLAPKYRYYDYEFERYWHFYQVFGRVGYNPATPAEVWSGEFRRRFGEAGPPLERALHRASWIPGMINAYNFPYGRFPTTRGWAEKQRREDLPEYAKAEGSDTEQFLGMADAARHVLEGTDSAKVWPQQSSRWFAEAAADVLEQVGRAEAVVGARRSREFVSTVVDLKILAHLALYHSRRALAGLSYALWEQSHDLGALDDAIAHERDAILAWEKVVEAAGDVYADDLRMGLARAGLSGHWRDELAALRAGLRKLEEQRQAGRVNGGAAASIPAAEVKEGLRYRMEAAGDEGRAKSSPDEGATPAFAVAVTDDDEPPQVRHTPLTTAPAAQPLAIRAEVTDPSGVKWVRLRYRGVNQHLDYKTLAMAPTGRPNEYQATVPAEDVNPRWDFMYFLEVMDRRGNGRIHPDLYREQPYVVVRLQR